MKSFKMQATLLLMALTVASSAVLADQRQAEKRVTFYSTYGYLKDQHWIIPMRLWVYEPPDTLRIAAAKALRGSLADRAGIDELNDEQKDLFAIRAHSFVADSESGETVVFRFDNDPLATNYSLSGGDDDNETDLNGLQEGFLSIEQTVVNQLLSVQRSENGWLTFRAVSEDHGGAGRIRLIPAEGLSVVSDIDDTIKITGIPSGEAEVLRNTFFRPFRAAPCMAFMYRDFGSAAAFHYVSGGPWQMYETLVEFVNREANGFPEGSFHMKNVRTNLFESESYQDIWKLTGGSGQATFEQKVEQINTLLRRFPERSFVLVGDSGERDPEVFATVRKQHPEQIIEIRIRDVRGDDDNNPQRLQAMTVINSEDKTCENNYPL